MRRKHIDESEESSAVKKIRRSREDSDHTRSEPEAFDVRKNKCLSAIRSCFIILFCFKLSFDPMKPNTNTNAELAMEEFRSQSLRRMTNTDKKSNSVEKNVTMVAQEIQSQVQVSTKEAKNKAVTPKATSTVSLSTKEYRIEWITDCYPSPWVNVQGSAILKKGDLPKMVEIKWCNDEETKSYKQKT